jgi:3-oxoacyl-[acyl-carrier protein] reductase
MRLSQRVVIVTGAGRGIGKAIALSCAKEGASVVVSARTLSEITAVAREISQSGGVALPVQADVTSEQNILELVEQTKNRFGRIDVLINNAGVGYFAPVKDLPTHEFETMWKVNVFGVYLCTKAVLPVMINQQGGDIVNVASLAGRNAFTGGSGYCATKWALIGFGRSVMLEVRQHNIRVITVCPGSVETTFAGEKADQNRAWVPKPQDIAAVVVGALGMPRNVMVSEIDIRPTNPVRS